METKELIEQAQKRADELFSTKQFICSEAVFYTINELLDSPVPPEMVKLASGFKQGIGLAGCVCGAIVGGVMALGLVFGREKQGGGCPRILPASTELHDWFKEQNRSTCCRVLIRPVKGEKGKHFAQCTELTGTTAAKTMEILLKYKDISRLKLLAKKIIS